METNLPSNFEQVSKMNIAFDNPKGNPQYIDYKRVHKQCLNIADEFGELMVAFGANKEAVKAAVANLKAVGSIRILDDISLEKVRDALCDIHVFGYGAHHLMGIDADADMTEVVSKVMTRFIKDDADLKATIKMHAENGITDVYVVGEYPTAILKSASDQPDAPKGKFLKSASYEEPKFYDPLLQTKQLDLDFPAQR